jgi:hypothetical protein
MQSDLNFELSRFHCDCVSIYTIQSTKYSRRNSNIPEELERTRQKYAS